MSTNLGHRQSSRIFWPKWYVRYGNGDQFPAQHTGPQCGPRPRRLEESHDDDTQPTPGGPFMCDTDVMFINNYVLERCEDPDATVGYVPDGALPGALQVASVRHVAVHAGCPLLVRAAGTGGDRPWGRPLRFVLRNFPRVETVTLVATAVLDAARPGACARPYEMVDVGAVALGDRARLGIVDDPDELGLHRRVRATVGGAQRPGDSVIRAWEDLERHWPSWGRRREAARGGEGEGAQARAAPELCLTGVVFFAKEWLSMEKHGEHGRSCRLVEEKLNPGVRSAVQMDRAAALASREGHVERTSTGTMYSTTTQSVKKTGFSRQRTKSSPCLRRLGSAPAARKPSRRSSCTEKDSQRKPMHANTSRKEEEEEERGLEMSPHAPPAERTATVLMFQHVEKQENIKKKRRGGEAKS